MFKLPNNDGAMKSLKTTLCKASDDNNNALLDLYWFVWWFPQHLNFFFIVLGHVFMEKNWTFKYTEVILLTIDNRFYHSVAQW